MFFFAQRILKILSELVLSRAIQLLAAYDEQIELFESIFFQICPKF